MDMSSVISQMVILFIVLAVGFAANKFKILNYDATRYLVKLVVNIGMPCTILSSVMSGKAGASGLGAAYFMLMVLASFALGFLLVLPLPRLLCGKKGDGGMVSFMAIFGNVGFIGFPVIHSLFGDCALFYVTLLNIPFSILSFSVGILMVSGSKGKLDPRVFVNTTLITCFIAVLLFYTRLHIPSIITDATALISNLTTPIAMLTIGSTLAEIPFKEVFSEWRVYPIALIKLLVFPLLVWLVFKPLIHDSLMLGVLVVLSGMPTATNATILSMEYGGNEKLASTGIFVTTLLSVVSIPLLIFLLFPH